MTRQEIIARLNADPTIAERAAEYLFEVAYKCGLATETVNDDDFGWMDEEFEIDGIEFTYLGENAAGRIERSTGLYAHSDYVEPDVQVPFDDQRAYEEFYWDGVCDAAEERREARSYEQSMWDNWSLWDLR